MYSNQMSLGSNPSGVQARSRGAYRRRDKKPAIDIHKISPNKCYGYIETRSGEYDDVERKFMADHYADGWAWCSAGNKLPNWKPSRFLSKAAKVEIVRLFTKGFNDCEELEHGKI